MNARIGVHTGGTFSDLVLIDEVSGAIRTAKVPSTPGDPSRDIRAGLVQLGAVDCVTMAGRTARERWIEVEPPWYETETIQCMVCGKLIPRRVWLFDGGAGEIRSCGPDCQSLHETYWQPTYGTLDPVARP